MATNEESPSERRLDATIPLLLGIVLPVVFSAQELITSGSLALVSLSWVKWGFVVAAAVLLLVVLLSSGTIWGPVALIAGACGFVVATLGLIVDSHTMFAGYAVVVGMALVFLSGVLETARCYSLGIP